MADDKEIPLDVVKSGLDMKNGETRKAYSGASGIFGRTFQNANLTIQRRGNKIRVFRGEKGWFDEPVREYDIKDGELRGYNQGSGFFGRLFQDRHETISVDEDRLKRFKGEKSFLQSSHEEGVIRDGKMDTYKGEPGVFGRTFQSPSEETRLGKKATSQTYDTGLTGFLNWLSGNPKRTIDD